MTQPGKLAKQRQAAIFQKVSSSGAVRVSDLVREHAVTDMTIRRDLEALAERGLVEKVHGGAVATQPATTNEPSFVAKELRNRLEKEAISACAAKLVQPGSAIGLSAGTTVFALASRLLDVPELTVVTNSVPVAEIFFRGGRTDQTVISSGGIRTPSDALVGPVAVRSIDSLNLNQVFLGVYGMNDDSGFTTPNLLEAEVDGAMIGRSPSLVVLADHTKWGTVGLGTIAPLDAARTVISDDGLDSAGREALSEQCGQLILVDAGPGDAASDPRAA
jgi:DeoR/GlpR family transcriptional regulator of sugar metabolism